MAPPFTFPPNLQALEEDHEDGTLSVQAAISISSLRPSELEEFVKGVSFDLSDKELFCIEEQDLFDRVYSLIKGFNCLTPACKFNLVESLRSNLSVLLPNVDSLSRANSQAQDDDDAGDSVIDRIDSHRNAFKIYTFVVSHTHTEFVSGDGEFVIPIVPNKIEQVNCQKNILELTDIF